MENTDEIRAVELTDKEIFTMIWTKPRIVFRYVNEFHYDKFTYVLLLLVAISNGLSRASTNHLGKENSLFFVIFMAVVVGGIFGMIIYHVYVGVTSLVGRWLGGSANTQALLRILAYAGIPLAMTFPIVIIRVLLFGNEMFDGNFELDHYGTITRIIYIISIIVEVALVFWFVFLWIVGISEVQGFSIGRALVNWLLAVLLIAVVLILVVVPFVLLT